MRVTFRQSGGISGLMRGCELDTASMDRSEGHALGALVEKCDFEDVQLTSQETARDILSYEITVEDGVHARKFSFDELSVPAAAAPLLEFLAERSGPMKT